MNVDRYYVCHCNGIKMVPARNEYKIKQEQRSVSMIELNVLTKRV